MAARHRARNCHKIMDTPHEKVCKSLALVVHQFSMLFHMFDLLKPASTPLCSVSGSAVIALYAGYATAGTRAARITPRNPATCTHSCNQHASFSHHKVHQ